MICYMNDGQPWHDAVDQYREELQSWAKMRINWADRQTDGFFEKTTVKMMMMMTIPVTAMNVETWIRTIIKKLYNL